MTENTQQLNRIFTAIFFLCYLAQISYAQNTVKKELVLDAVNASMNKQKSKLILVHEDESVFEIPDSLSQYNYFIFKNELKSHLTTIGEQEEQYWSQLPILLCYNKKKIILGLDTDHDNNFEGEEFYMSNSLDSTFSVHFNFRHKYNNAKDISIPVNLKVLLSERLVRLTIQYDVFFTTDATGLDGSENYINVFPFTGMARYEVEPKEASPAEIYFNDELIDINGIYWRIASFDYTLKKLWMDSVGVLERPIGYRVGQYLDEPIVRKAFDKLSVHSNPIDLSKDYTILHFWGEWCQPCLEEIPRLKKLLLSIDNEKVSVVHVNFLPETSNRTETLDFISSLNLEGNHLLDNASAEYSLVQLLNNRAFPGYVIFDTDFKIVYRADENDMNLPTFLKSKGIL